MKKVSGKPDDSPFFVIFVNKRCIINVTKDEATEIELMFEKIFISAYKSSRIQTRNFVSGCCLQLLSTEETEDT